MLLFFLSLPLHFFPAVVSLDHLVAPDLLSGKQADEHPALLRPAALPSSTLLLPLLCLNLAGLDSISTCTSMLLPSLEQERIPECKLSSKTSQLTQQNKLCFPRYVAKKVREMSVTSEKLNVYTDQPPKGKHKSERSNTLLSYSMVFLFGNNLGKYKQLQIIQFVIKSAVSKGNHKSRTAEACLGYPSTSKAYSSSTFSTVLLPVQRDVGVQNGSRHCFGAGIVTNCSQANCARFPAQTVSFFLHICLYFQSWREKRKESCIYCCYS